MKRLLLIVATLSGSLSRAQGPVQRVTKEPPLGGKQVLAPGLELAGDVRRKVVSNAPAPAMTYPQFAEEVELFTHDERLLQIEIRKFLLRKEREQRQQGDTGPGALPPPVAPWII